MAHFARRGAVIPWLAFVAMLLALVGNLYPVPEGPYGKLPYVYLAISCGGYAVVFAAAERQQRNQLNERR